MFGEPFDRVCIYVGAFHIALAVLGLVGYLLRVLLRRIPSNLLKKYGIGSWAVITGSSDGIGRAFAEQLAKRGFNLVLIARNKTKLEKVASEIKALNNKISIKIVVADFLNAHEVKFYDEIYSQIKDLDISILINNVGLDVFEVFHSVDETAYRNLLTVNIFPTVLLTRKLIDHFRSRQRRSAIINVSSNSSVKPLPYLGTYGATKNFEDHFTRSLQIEYPEIDMLSLRPGYVMTNMTLGKQDFETISAEDCAEGALRDLGRYLRTSSHVKHDFLAWFMDIAPTWIFNFGAKNFVMKRELNRRRETLKKTQKKE